MLGNNCVGYNLTGIKKLWITSKPDGITYTVDDATYKTLTFYGNNIITIDQFSDSLDWDLFAQNISNVAYAQKLRIGKQGYVFEETLSLVIPRITNEKWNELTDIFNGSFMVAFQDNNDSYFIMGYDDPVRLNDFKMSYGNKDGENSYELEFFVNGNYNLLKFLNPTVLS